MPRKRDLIVVETDAGVFDAYESLEVVNDLIGVSEATLSIGDDGAWPKLEQLLEPGTPFRVKLNSRLRLTGRAEVITAPGTPEGGVSITLVVRTKLSDARYASADPAINVQNTTIKQFVLACYKPLGLVESDFIFSNALADVQLMTGKSAQGTVADLAPITVQQATIQPPETVYQAVERHLMRYRCIHWDSPDGRIVVGRPDDAQRPLYRLLAKRGAASKANNLASFERIRDWTDVARTVRVHGQTWGKDVTKSQFKGEAVDADVDAVAAKTGHFNRLVLIQDQQSKENASAKRAAQRELSARSRRKDAFRCKTDAWTYWTGTEQIPWANNTTADVDVDALGGVQGRYLITRTSLRLDLGSATSAELTLVGPGIWAL